MNIPRDIALKPTPSIWQRVVRWVLCHPPECRVVGCDNRDWLSAGFCETCQIDFVIARPEPKPEQRFEPLPEFTLRSVCAKCGEATEKMRYCDGAPCVIGESWTTGRGPHLHRACNRCGFDWLTQTKDADPAPVIDRTYLRGDPPPPPKNLKVRNP
jgi:hypothetical protein